jgi:hypothetical protein
MELKVFHPWRRRALVLFLLAAWASTNELIVTKTSCEDHRGSNPAGWPGEAKQH